MQSGERGKRVRPGGRRAEGVSAGAARRALQAEIVGVSPGPADAQGTATDDHHGQTAATATLLARPHQGISQQVPDAGRDVLLPSVTNLDTARIHRKPVLDGLINEYAHAA